jgi:prepilin-type N-terminal cleavage/methylation domain-containing protein
MEKFFKNRRVKKTNRAFTLIEVMVSVSIFAVVMLVSTGAIFSIVQANKKTHSLKSVMTNLNFALESMMRDIRVGTKYSCGGGGDCYPTPGTVFTFKANRDVNGDGVANDNDKIQFSLVGTQIQKEIQGNGVKDYLITAPEINIQSLKFYVFGSAANDQKQPKVVITIQGNAGTGTDQSNFTIETTVSQRSIDS